MNKAIAVYRRPKSYSLSSRRLRRRRLRLIPILIFLLIHIMGVTSMPISENYIEKENIYTYQEYTIQSGDTLWSIAERYVEDDADVRPIIDHIIEINQLSDSTTLQPGQTIAIDLPDENIE